MNEVSLKPDIEFRKNGSEDIERLIQLGIENGTREAIIIGDWEITRAVKIPTNFKLILDNCHLRMADDTFDNMFVNEHYGTEESRAVSGTDRDISIIGRGNVILDGGKFNGLSEKTARKDGMPPIYKNNLILFSNVDGFEIRNISVRHQRYWALNFYYCANGEITDISFEADDTCIDNDGNVSHGLSDLKYYDMLVKNSDGIDIRQGCHHILIENIYGFTGDDTVALTSLNGRGEREHSVSGLPSDICYIKVKNIVSESLAANVRLLCQGGAHLHHILVDGVEDISDQTDHLVTHGHYGVHINDTRMYGSRHATEDEMYNITVKNIRSRANYALGIAGGKIKKLVCENIVCFDGAGYIEDLREVE